MGMNKIVLGTAQFGFDYGVNNQRGQVPQTEVFEILAAAFRLGVETLDTASMYGASENVIGKFIKKYNKKFNIISKIGNVERLKIKPLLISSLVELGVDSFYGLLIHGFRYYANNPEIWEILKEMKSEGKAKKIGFSIYSPDELEALFQQGIELDQIQVPYNIFDRRFEPYFPILQSKGIEIYVRSIFLQGIVFMNPGDLKDNLLMLKDKIIKMNILSKQENISIASLCANFVFLNQFVDKVVFGVDGLDNFNEINCFLEDFSKICAISHKGRWVR